MKKYIYFFYFKLCLGFFKIIVFLMVKFKIWRKYVFNRNFNYVEKYNFL